MSKLATVDFSLFKSGSELERQMIADQIVGSFKQHGFVKLLNHGISCEIVHDLLEWSKRMFDLNLELKQEFANVPSAGPQRGWSHIGAETTARLREENLRGAPEGDLMDEKEHFDCGPAEDDQFPNRWPAAQHIPGFREFMESYYSTSQEISLKIIEACEVGLCLNPGTLVNQCMPTASELRLIHYPTVPTAKLKDGHTKRCWPHSDFGVISLLFQDNVGGLEIEDRANPGTFVPVLNGYPAEMVVNISDTFQRWSNDALKVGIHQVTTPGHMGGMGLDILPERFSAVFFCKAHRETLVGSLPAFVRPEKPAAYDNITALQFQRERTRKVY